MTTMILFVLAISQLNTMAFAEQFVCDNALKEHKNFNLLPHDADCRPWNPSPRILGGGDTSLGEFPSLVVLFLNHSMMRFEKKCERNLVDHEMFKKYDMSSVDVQAMWCTGSIINSKYIITAAHCLPRDILTLYDLLVRVGENDLLTERDCDDIQCAPPTITYHVDKYIPHPQYNTLSNANDVGLVRVHGEIHWNDYVYPACIPTSCDLINKNFEGDVMTVAGFGALVDTPDTQKASRLQKVSLQGAPEYNCLSSYKTNVLSSQICVGGSEVGDMNKDACHGDSGGPLMYHGRRGASSGLVYLVGVVSSGENCTMIRNEQAPGIYTKVGAFLPWILDTIYE